MKHTVVVWTVVVFASAAPVYAQHAGGTPKPNSHMSAPTKAAPAPHGHSAGKATGSESSRPATGAKTKTSTKTTTANTATGTLSPVQLKLQRNTQLAGKLQSRLAGADVVTAASGFRNLGQFVAAVNVSHNLGIPFADLKTQM